MKLFDWVLLLFTFTWIAFFIIKLLYVLDSREARQGRANIKIGYPVIFIPVLCWLIIAYRVGG